MVLAMVMVMVLVMVLDGDGVGYGDGDCVGDGVTVTLIVVENNGYSVREERLWIKRVRVMMSESDGYGVTVV
jgi:hypothetical protein